MMLQDVDMYFYDLLHIDGLLYAGYSIFVCVQDLKYHIAYAFA